MNKVLDKIYPTKFGGRVTFSSPLEIEEVGKLIGEKMFAGLVFEGLDMNIHDEVPTVLIIKSVMGIRFWISQDYDTDPNIRFYTLGCTQTYEIDSSHNPYTPVLLDVYLRALMKETFPEGIGLVNVE
jgi:hypothetical protein